jgi:hypothetical protein
LSGGDNVAKVTDKFGAININHAFSKKWNITSFAAYSSTENQAITNSQRGIFQPNSTQVATLENRSTTSNSLNNAFIAKFGSKYKPNTNFQLDYDVFLRRNNQQDNTNNLSNSTSFINGNSLSNSNSIVSFQKQDPISFNQSLNLFYTQNPKTTWVVELQHQYEDEDPFYNAEQGLGFLAWMHEQQAEYMKIVPSAGTFIEELSKHDLRYIIHEYYAEDWRPLWFKEMNQKMEHSGLTFAGQVPFYLNIGEIALPEGFEDMLAIGEDVIQFEMYKDFIRNTMFRWDIYAHGTRDMLDPFDTLHFGKVTLHDASYSDIQLPGSRTFHLDEEVHAPIMQAIASGCSTASKIANELSLDKAIVQDALINLLSAEQIKPITLDQGSDLSLGTFIQSVLAFLEEATMRDEHVIPSLYSGSGIIISKDTALFLLATIKHQEDAIDWIAEWMEFHGYGSFNMTRIHAEESYSTFMTTIPFWKRMGIL